MSLSALSWAMSCELVQTTSQRMVLLVLADHHNGESGRCDPSIDRIANRARCSRRTVERTLDELESLGLIVRRRRSSADGLKISNAYGLTFIDGPPVPSADASPCRNDATNATDRCDIVSPTDASPCRINLEQSNQEKNQRARAREVSHTGGRQAGQSLPADLSQHPALVAERNQAPPPPIREAPDEVVRDHLAEARKALGMRPEPESTT